MKVPDAGFKAIADKLVENQTSQAVHSFVGYRVKNAFTGEFRAVFKHGHQEYTLDQYQCEQILKGYRPDSDKHKAASAALKHWPSA